jgi:alpha-tubulin suppressor-like RCC1 family protein
LSDIVAISAEGAHTLALTRYGALWAWGANHFGQLGDGTTTDKHTPVHVLELPPVVATFAGGAHNTALHGDGTLWSWGANHYGQLGNGMSATVSETPVTVTGLSNVVAVAAGNTFTIVLKEDGSVWSWGNNEHGQLGDGTSIDRNTPVQVSGL